MYTEKNYTHLLGIPGMSDTLLTNHFTLYSGYVKNTNTLRERLKNLLEEDKTGPGEYAELKRRFGWEFSGMRLHELYFDAMTKEVKEIQSKTKELIEKNFGTVDNWKKDFIATGSMRGIGWVLLVHDKTTNTLMNIWINEHDTGHLPGLTPLLVMDVFEHAYITDYQLKKTDYIQTYMNTIDWEVVEERI